MEAGDKVLVLLLARVAGRVGLTLATTGALGGLGVWPLDDAGRSLLGAALVGLILAVVLRSSKHTDAGALAEGRAQLRSEPARRW